ncbi:DUF6103 family protein [Lachnospiraceae bacterium 66-29]
MKNTTLTMSFNTERLDALTYHMGKKEADLQEELKDYLQKLYEKYVPQATREYLDDRIAREENAKPSRPNRQRSAAAQTTE